jgi:GT2 family glycosyltransferase
MFSVSEIELVIIMNSFNRIQLLEGAMTSIINTVEQAELSSAFVIFDAGSTDGSIELIDQLIKQQNKTQIFRIEPSHPSATSFSVGCNQAMQFASHHFPNLKYCLFFETDNLIHNKNALLQGIKLLDANPQLAAVGFTVESISGEKAGFGCSFPSILSFILGQQMTQRLRLDQPQIQWQAFPQSSQKDSQEIRSELRWGLLDIAYTSPLLVRHSAWQTIGEMDTLNFPFSDSDSDWCWRAKKQEWGIAVLDTPGVIHDNRSSPSEWSAKRVSEFHRARFRLLQKHRNMIVFWMRLALLCRHISELLILLLKSCSSDRARDSLQQRITLIKTVMNGYQHLNYDH